MSLGMEVGLGPGDFVLDGDPAPPSQKAEIRREKKERKKEEEEEERNHRATIIKYFNRFLGCNYVT